MDARESASTLMTAHALQLDHLKREKAGVEYTLMEARITIAGLTDRLRAAEEERASAEEAWQASSAAALSEARIEVTNLMVKVASMGKESEAQAAAVDMLKRGLEERISSTVAELEETKAGLMASRAATVTSQTTALSHLVAYNFDREKMEFDLALTKQVRSPSVR